MVGHTDSKLLALFILVRERLEARRIAVIDCDQDGEGYGFFVPATAPDDQYAGRIRIFRKTALIEENVLRDLCVLAHEGGHAERFLRGERTPEYEQAVTKLNTSGEQLSEAEKDVIRREERGAWDVARATLDELGFQDWESFEARRHEGLEFYEDQFAAT